MRLVLDTNVLVRVIISPTGLAAEHWRRIRWEHLLVLSAPIVLELLQVLGYERVRRIHGLDDALLGQLVDEIVSGSLFVALPSPLPQVVPDHPADDVIVATAVQGEASVIAPET